MVLYVADGWRTNKLKGAGGSLKVTINHIKPLKITLKPTTPPGSESRTLSEGCRFSGGIRDKKSL